MKYSNNIILKIKIICKERNIKTIHSKNKKTIINLIQKKEIITNSIINNNINTNLIIKDTYTENLLKEQIQQKITKSKLKIIKQINQNFI